MATSCSLQAHIIFYYIHPEWPVIMMYNDDYVFPATSHFIHIIVCVLWAEIMLHHPLCSLWYISPPESLLLLCGFFYYYLWMQTQPVYSLLSLFNVQGLISVCLCAKSYSFTAQRPPFRGIWIPGQLHHDRSCEYHRAVVPCSSGRSMLRAAHT